MRALPWLLAPLAAAAGQSAPRPPVLQPEVRIDAIAPRPATAQLGAGVELPFGYYARVGLVSAAGLATSSGRTPLTAAGRVDAVARFLLDPFQETHLGLSLGGGVSLRYDVDRGWRPYLVVLADVEGRRRGGVVPALQLGLGGGTRVGLALRRYDAGRR